MLIFFVCVCRRTTIRRLKVDYRPFQSLMTARTRKSFSVQRNLVIGNVWQTISLTTHAAYDENQICYIHLTYPILELLFSKKTSPVQNTTLINSLDVSLGIRIRLPDRNGHHLQAANLMKTNG